MCAKLVYITQLILPSLCCFFKETDLFYIIRHWPSCYEWNYTANDRDIPGTSFIFSMEIKYTGPKIIGDFVCWWPDLAFVVWTSYYSLQECRTWLIKSVIHGAVVHVDQWDHFFGDLLNALRSPFCTLTTHSWLNWGDGVIDEEEVRWLERKARRH